MRILSATLLLCLVFFGASAQDLSAMRNALKWDHFYGAVSKYSPKDTAYNLRYEIEETLELTKGDRLVVEVTAEQPGMVVQVLREDGSPVISRRAQVNGPKWVSDFYWSVDQPGTYQLAVFKDPGARYIHYAGVFLIEGVPLSSVASNSSYGDKVAYVMTHLEEDLRLLRGMDLGTANQYRHYECNFRVSGFHQPIIRRLDRGHWHYETVVGIAPDLARAQPVWDKWLRKYEAVFGQWGELRSDCPGKDDSTDPDYLFKQREVKRRWADTKKWDANSTGKSSLVLRATESGGYVVVLRIYQ